MGALRFPGVFSHVWAPHVVCSVNTNTRTHAVSIRDTQTPLCPQPYYRVEWVIYHRPLTDTDWRSGPVTSKKHTV